MEDAATAAIGVATLVTAADALTVDLAAVVAVGPITQPAAGTFTADEVAGRGTQQWQ